jgi:hypothetical protein
MKFASLTHFFKKKEVKMKFLALKNFHYLDKKTGNLKSLAKGDALELQSNELGIIDDLIMNLLITPDDTLLVADSALYQVLHQFNIQFGGESLRGNVGSQLMLKRDMAVYLMACGYIRPEDQEKWWPGKRDHGIETEAKRMYDEEEGQENPKGWLTSWKDK